MVEFVYPLKANEQASQRLMNKICKSVTQPGVITQVLQEAVEEKGLFYPPDPASKGSCLYRWKYC